MSTARNPVPAVPSDLKVVLVHDYLTQRGGAERVALTMAEFFRPVEIVTAFYDPERTFPAFGAFSVRPLWTNRIKLFRGDPRLSLPLMPLAFGRAMVSGADAVLVSSSGFAHGIHTDLPKVVYCHNPPRWLYQREDYVGGGARGAILSSALAPISPWLKRWDRTAARSAAIYIANSTNVARRVQEAYGIDATVLHPPVALLQGPETAANEIAPGYLLAVARNRAYKNMEEVIAATAIAGERLVIVGGYEARRQDHVHSVGEVTDAQLRWLYRNCRALVSAAREDFGLTVIEANSYGRPVVVLRAGGFMETVIEDTTGTYFDFPDAGSIAAAIVRLRTLPINESLLRAHAERFSHDAFFGCLEKMVSEVVARSAGSGFRMSPRGE